MQLGDGYAAAGDDHRAQLCYANALRASRNQPIVTLPAAPATPLETGIETRDAQGLPHLADDRDLPPRV